MVSYRSAQGWARLSATGTVLTMMLALLSMVSVGAAHAAPAHQAAGAIPPGSAFVAAGPVRVTDTRSGAPLGPSGTVTVPLATSVPASAAAVALSVTAVDGTTPGYLSVSPTGSTPSSPTSVLNYVAGPPNCTVPDCVVPNLVISKLGQGSAGDRSVTVANGSAGTVDVVVDLEGYFDPTGATTSGAGHYTASGSARVADTRCGATPPGGALSAAQCAGEHLLAANAPLATAGPGGTLKVATGLSGAAAVVQLTATDTSASGYLTAYGNGTRPTASNVNFVAAQTTSTRAIVPVAPDGSINVFNYAGTTDVIVDVVGSFSGPSGLASAGSLFTPINPERVIDTRDGTNGVAQGASTTVAIAGAAGIPALANGGPVAAALNVTEAADTAPGYLSVTPSPSSTPVTSDVNFSYVPEIRANADIAALDRSGAVSVYNYSGQTQVVVDAFGYFSAVHAPPPVPRPLSVTTTSLPEGVVGQAHTQLLLYGAYTHSYDDAGTDEVQPRGAHPAR